MARKRVPSERDESRARMTNLEAAAKAFGAFRPAAEVLRRVRAVPTRFVQFDHASKVGGLPIERFMLIHGPSGEGKTYFSLGLIDSFLAFDNPALLVDAERTSPITWPEKIMGRARAHHPLFFAERPSTYESTVSTVRRFLLTVKRQRDEGVLAPDSSAIVVVDSFRKLVPAGILDKIMKDAEKNGIDGMGGRAAQIKAAMNAQWMDELIPLLEETQCAFVAIARETDDGDADKWAKLAGTDYKVGGGKALYYDSSLVMRVEREGWVYESGGDESAKKRVFGERHRITIRKTKVAGQETKQTVARFFTSNGVLTPEGFDRARDVVELAVTFGVIEQKGAWFSAGGERLGQGLNNVVERLTNTPEQLAEVEVATRAAFATNAPPEHDEDGVVE